MIAAVRFAIISFEGDKKNKWSAMSAIPDNSILGIKEKEKKEDNLPEPDE